MFSFKWCYELIIKDIERLKYDFKSFRLFKSVDTQILNS